MSVMEKNNNIDISNGTAMRLCSCYVGNNEPNVKSIFNATINYKNLECHIGQIDKVLKNIL